MGEYQGLYKNHSFIIRRSWDWIHINETSIEFGSQSRSWINIKIKTKQTKKNTQTNKEKTKRQKQKQNKNNYEVFKYFIIHNKVLWLFIHDFFPWVFPGYGHTVILFPGYSKCGKNILWLSFLWPFFSYLSCDFLSCDFFFCLPLS